MFDIRQSVFDENEIDYDRFHDYVDDLMKAFDAAPEAQPVKEALGNIGWTNSMMDLAANHLGVTVANMSVADFDEVVFDLFPRKMSVDADAAADIVMELRAFWSFIDRQYALPQAQLILRFLDADASDRLHKRLADPRNYGMAKSMVMSGKAAGFDMTTEEGCARFMAYYNANLARQVPQDPPANMRNGYFTLLNDDDLSTGDLPAERPTGLLLKKKRQDRKRERQARKKSRRR